MWTEWRYSVQVSQPDSNMVSPTAWYTAIFVSLCTHTHTRTHARTHMFNGPLSGTTRVRRYQKGKTNLDFTEARDNEWQWHQLGYMQVCTSLQRDNHASTTPLTLAVLPVSQPTASQHCKLPQRGLGRSPSRNRIWCIIALKYDIWWQQL